MKLNLRSLIDLLQMLKSQQRVALMLHRFQSLLKLLVSSQNDFLNHSRLDLLTQHVKCWHIWPQKLVFRLISRASGSRRFAGLTHQSFCREIVRSINVIKVETRPRLVELVHLSVIAFLIALFQK